jgi:GT2 family glycosyltransferase/SAM-dependent methyltransferase
MSGEQELLGLDEDSGRTAYEHLHRYAIWREYAGGKRVLDLACGTGHGSYIIASEAAEVVGIDVNASAIRRASKSFTRPNLKFMVADGVDLPFDAQSFDVVIANEILDHVDNPEALASEARRVLADGGLFLASTPTKSVHNQSKNAHQLHASQSELEEFRELLSRNFGHVHYTGLRMALISAGYDLDSDEHGANLASAKLYHGSISSGGRTGVENEEFSLENPDYILATCSDRPIDTARLRSSVFYSRESDLWLEHEQYRGEAGKSADVTAQALDQQREALTREASATLATTARLVGHMVSAPVEPDQISLVEAMFKLNETTVTRRLKLEALERRSADLETELASLRADGAQRQAQLQADLQRAVTESTAQKGRASDFEVKAAAALQNVDRLQDQLSEVLAESARRSDEATALFDAKESELRRRFISAQKDADMRQVQLAELRTEFDSLKRDAGEQKDQIADLLDQLTVARHEVGARDAQLKLMREETENLTAAAAEKADELELTVTTLREEIKAAQAEARARDAELKLMREQTQKLTAATERADELELIVAKLREELKAAQAKVELQQESRAGAKSSTRNGDAKRVVSGSDSGRDAGIASSTKRLHSMESRREAAFLRRKVRFSTRHRRIQEQLSRANEAVRGRTLAAPPARSKSWIERLKGKSTPFQTILFEADWLERQNPHLGSVTIERYLKDSSLFELDPHPLFAARTYLDHYPDVASSGIAPLEHYTRIGWREGRDPHPYFANDWYLHQNADVLAQGDLSPLEHYLTHGWKEGRRPNPAFDPRAYLDRYPDVMEAGFEPLTHYVIHGAAESREIPFAEGEADWRNLVPSAGSRSLLDFLLKCPPEEVPTDSAALAMPQSFGVPQSLDEDRDGVSSTWPPTPINDYWLPQPLRDFTVTQHGEDAVPLYWYLCSVMDYYSDDPDGFAKSRACRDVVARAHSLSLARAEAEVARPDATIVIPVYNNILDTLLCLVSVLESETTASFEVIVADDGSSDDTASLVSQIGGIVRHLRQPHNLGFLGNCNAAAQVAHGQTLVLLNNDTLVLPGWLDGLLDPFDQHDRVGIVGSKLLNWDGTLQEAGGIFWEDGSAWNFGRGMDPLSPEFSYLKDVDYCSGASIAIPIGLWQQLGGFDTLYEPAYCEDADLAFRVRAAGFRTLYNPLSEVVHHEGRSHGRDLSSGIKAHQVTNQERFLDRWGDVLAREHYPNAQNVLEARDRSSSRPHVLVIDHNVPQWDRDAGSRTIYQYIDVLLDLGCAVTFWPENLYRDPQYVSQLQSMGVEVIYGPRFRNGFDDFIRERGGLYDAVFLSRPEVATNFLPALRSHSDARILYYGHDLHFRRLQSNLELGGNVDPAEIDRIREVELDVCRDCDVIFYPDPEEVELIADEVGGDREFIANPVFIYSADQIATARTKLPAIKDNQSRRLLFVGGFNHHPNREGIIWFVNEVMPLIRNELDGVTLDIAGSNPPPEVLGLAGSDVAVLGLVSDTHLQQLYAAASLAVAPLRYGAGVKGKVIEALALGVPVATTPIGAQGIGPGDDILFLGESAVELAGAIVEALTERETAEDKARQGLIFIEDHYGRDAMRRLFERLIVDSRSKGA